MSPKLGQKIHALSLLYLSMTIWTAPATVNISPKKKFAPIDYLVPPSGHIVATDVIKMLFLLSFTVNVS